MRELKKEEIEYAIGRLEVYMTSRGLNQNDLDGLSGVEQSTISKILKRKQEPSLENLQKLFARSRSAARGRVESRRGPPTENPARLSGDAADGSLRCGGFLGASRCRGGAALRRRGGIPGPARRMSIGRASTRTQNKIRNTRPPRSI